MYFFEDRISNVQVIHLSDVEATMISQSAKRVWESDIVQYISRNPEF